MKLSTQIIENLKNSAPFMQHVEGYDDRRMLRHALGLPDDSKPRTERIAKEKGLPLYARKIEGEKPLGSFAEIHATRALQRQLHSTSINAGTALDRAAARSLTRAPCRRPEPAQTVVVPGVQRSGA